MLAQFVQILTELMYKLKIPKIDKRNTVLENLPPPNGNHADFCNLIDPSQPPTCQVIIDHIIKVTEDAMNK